MEVNIKAVVTQFIQSTSCGTTPLRIFLEYSVTLASITVALAFSSVRPMASWVRPNRNGSMTSESSCTVHCKGINSISKEKY